MSKIVTFSNRTVDLLNFKEQDVNIEDISHALSMTCRFVGHVKFHYSVAYHSIIVSYLCKPEHSLIGLLHDASEAYIQDIPSPLKATEYFALYRDLEKHITSKIYNSFGLPEEEPVDVKAADKLAFLIEQKQLTKVYTDLDLDLIFNKYPIARIHKSDPADINNMFLNRYYELLGKKVVNA